VRLTGEERDRVDALLAPMAKLLDRMRAAGVQNPVRVVRAALGAGPDAASAPVLALARGVDSEAILWAGEIELLLRVHDLADGCRLRDCAHSALDCLGSLAVGSREYDVH
jgi:hypothetical protein